MTDGPSSHRPRVTVVTPTLNAAKYFAATLASLNEQRRTLDVEHIVVDDGSTDGTLEMAVEAGATVIRGRNRGIYAAMNLGLDAASGEHVGVLNADDMLLPNALALLTRAMHDSGRPWAVGTLRWVDADGRLIGDLRPPPDWVPASALACLRWSYIAHPATYMRRELWSRLGGFDVGLPVAADYDLLIRARRESPFARVTVPTTAFRRHGDNASRTSPQLFADGEEVRRRHGLQGPARARLVGVSVSAWANLRNPRWALHKRAGFG